MDVIARHLTRKKTESASLRVTCNGKKRCGYWPDRQENNRCFRIWVPSRL